jgi:hypothetical protein
VALAAAAFAAVAIADDETVSSRAWKGAEATSG